jgi:hypothetical protein
MLASYGGSRNRSGLPTNCEGEHPMRRRVLNRQATIWSEVVNERVLGTPIQGRCLGTDRHVDVKIVYPVCRYTKDSSVYVPREYM